MTTRMQHEQNLIDELLTGDELRYAFLRDPRRTLEDVGDWGLSEIHSLISARPPQRDGFLEELDA